MNKEHIMIFTGEVSGENHAYHLIKSLKTKSPSLQISGVGSDIMSDAGCQCIASITSLNCFQVSYFKKLILRRTLNSIVEKVEEHVKQTKPSLFVFVGIADDTQYFVKKLLKLAKKYNIKTAYYFSPHVWLWSKRKTKKVAQEVDVIFSFFEREYNEYQKGGANTINVGHPVLDELPEKYSRKKLLKEYGLPENVKLVALLPGSRKTELKYHSKILYETMKSNTNPEVYFISAVLEDELSLKVRDKFNSIKKHKFLKNKSDYYKLISCADIAFVSSGTATLETASYETPQIVFYKLNSVNYFIMKAIAFLHGITRYYIAMPNIIVNKHVVPEFIQKRASVNNLLSEMNALLLDSKVQRKKLANLKKHLGVCGGVTSTAEEIIKLLQE